MSGSDSVLAGRMGVAIKGSRGLQRAPFRRPAVAFPIRRIDAGKLELPTGRMCVTDIYSADSFPPLNRIVPPGSYDAALVIAQLPEDDPWGGERCAFLTVKFADETVESWEPATSVAAAKPCFDDANPNSFIQDGATGVFSPEAGAVHFAHLKQQYDEQIKLIRKRASRFGSRDWINYRPGEDAANVIIAEGGYGDGQYTCWFGMTRPGRVAWLVIDYDVADPLPG